MSGEPRHRDTTGLALVLLGWAALGCGGETFALAWPSLAPDTRSVVIAVECAGQLGVRLSTPEEALDAPLRIAGCEHGFISLLEYASTLEEHGLVPGVLPTDATRECGALALPVASRTHSLVLEPEIEPALRTLSEGEARPGALADFKTRQLCPCRPMWRYGVLEVPRHLLYFVRHEAASRTWVFGVSGERLEIFGTDLVSVSLVHTGTVAVGPDPSGRDPRAGVKDVVPGPEGRFYLGGERGRIYVFSEREGLKHALTVPGEAPVTRLAVGDGSAGLELYALLDNNEVWRHAEGVWFAYRGSFEPGSGSSQRPGLAWLRPGRAAGMPDRGRDVFVTEDDRLDIVPWTQGGGIHAIAHVDGMGLVVGARDSRMYLIDPDAPAAPRELMGESGEAPAPTQAWFQQIQPTARGFLASLDGPNSFLEYASPWGYCPQQFFDYEDVNLTRFDLVDGRVLAGGGIEGSAPTEGPVELPIFEWH